jgi:hypothetical protein
MSLFSNIINKISGKKAASKGKKTPWLDSLVPVSAKSYTYDPRIRYIACSSDGKSVHLGYKLREGKPDIKVHCHKKGASTIHFKELEGVDLDEINCKRCNQRIEVLQNSKSELRKAVDDQQRYYHGIFASGTEIESRRKLIHLVIIPFGSDKNDPDLRPFCGSLTPKLSYSIIPDCDTSKITCKFCRENFSKLPQRDENGEPYGKADLWFIMGPESHLDIKPTLVKDANFEKVSDSDDDSGDDDDDFISITKYK